MATEHISPQEAEERRSDFEQALEESGAVGGLPAGHAQVRFGSLLLAIGLTSCFPAAAQTQPHLAPVRNVMEIHFGFAVHDPYRYMEDLADPDVQTWLKEQADLARAVLDRIPGREGLRSRVEQLRNATPARVGEVRISGAWVYSLKRLAAESVPRLYARSGFHGKDRLLVDPEAMPAPKGSHKPSCIPI